MVVDAAESWAADGFSTFKLKLGAETAKTRVEPGFLRSRDVGLVRAVREALGPRARIRVDTNGAWDVETAKRTLSELEPYEIELAEQPVGDPRGGDGGGRLDAIPLAGDESVESRADAERAVAMEACRMTGVKLSKVGGPEEAIEIAEILPAYLSSALDGPVGIAAAAQVAETLDETAGAEVPASPTDSLPSGSSPRRSPRSSAGSKRAMLHLPDGPGLGSRDRRGGAASAPSLASNVICPPYTG